MNAAPGVRRVCMVLGLLDLIIFARHALPAAERCLRYFHSASAWPAPVLVIESVRALLFPSFIATGAGLLAGRTWALRLSAAQAPARILLIALDNDGAAATFGFLQDAGRALSAGVVLQHALLAAVALLELARAFLAVQMVRRRRGMASAPVGHHNTVAMK